MDDMMRTILTVVADSYDSYRPGAGDCVRRKILEDEAKTPQPEVQGGKDTQLKSHDDEERLSIPCSMCGKPTTFDPTYGDLCYRCCRTSNE